MRDQKLTDPDGAADDHFGLSVAISGDTAIVGANRDDDPVLGANAGSASVLQYDGSSWVQQQKLLDPDGAAGGQFGYSVAIDGDTAIIAAHLDDDGAGSATIFRYDGTQWMDESPLDYENTFLAVSGGGDGSVIASGTHELLLGPLLPVPENVKPTDGGAMGLDYEISWTHKELTDPHFTYVEVAIPTMMGPLPEWTVMNDWYVTDVLLPDFPNIEGTPGIGPGQKILNIIRVYKEGFDIDNYSNQDLNTYGWRSWAFSSTTFTKN